MVNIEMTNAIIISGQINREIFAVFSSLIRMFDFSINGIITINATNNTPKIINTFIYCPRFCDQHTLNLTHYFNYKPIAYFIAWRFIGPDLLANFKPIPLTICAGNNELENPA